MGAHQGVGRTMELFEIIESPTPNYAAMVMAVGIHRPWEEQERLERVLQEQGVRGPVLFDLLLTNASATRRFFVAEFDGTQFVRLGAASRVQPGMEVESASAAFFRESFARLNPALLSLAQRYCLQQGLLINPSKPAEVTI